MAGLSWSDDHREMSVLLQRVTKAGRLTQVDVARAFGRAQSFTFKIERGRFGSTRSSYSALRNSGVEVEALLSREAK